MPCDVAITFMGVYPAGIPEQVWGIRIVCDVGKWNHPQMATIRGHGIPESRPGGL